MAERLTVTFVDVYDTENDPDSNKVETEEKEVPVGTNEKGTPSFVTVVKTLFKVLRSKITHI